MHDAGSTKLLCNLPDHDERYHERRLLQPLATAVVRPGGGVYTQKPFLAVSVFFTLLESYRVRLCDFGMAESRFYVGNEQITANVFLSGFRSFNT